MYKLAYYLKPVATNYDKITTTAPFSANFHSAKCTFRKFAFRKVDLPASERVSVSVNGLRGVSRVRLNRPTSICDY